MTVTFKPGRNVEQRVAMERGGVLDEEAVAGE